MFRLISNHYDDNAFNRLVELHRRKPRYGLGELIERAFEVDNALEGLWQVAREADRRVQVLHDTYTAATYGESPAGTKKATQSSEQHLAATVYKPSQPRTDTTLPLSLCKSFGIAEEEAARKRLACSDTLSKPEYVTNAFADSHSNPASQSGGSATARHRKDKNVPRVFTGSFSELESDIRSLELHKVKTPGKVGEESSDVMIRDFGASAVDSPCLSPIPPTLLQRREAIVSKDTELYQRIVNGEVVTSRRPSTKGRTPTVDPDASLEECLKEASRKPEMPLAPSLDAQRGKHRENSI